MDVTAALDGSGGGPVPGHAIGSPARPMTSAHDYPYQALHQGKLLRDVTRERQEAPPGIR